MLYYGTFMTLKASSQTFFLDDTIPSKQRDWTGLGRDDIVDIVYIYMFLSYLKSICGWIYNLSSVWIYNSLSVADLAA
jgi:hypothetical protein